MLEYEKIDLTPLIENLEKEYSILEDQYKIFLSITETIEKTTVKYQNLQDRDKIQNL